MDAGIEKICTAISQYFDLQTEECYRDGKAEQKMEDKDKFRSWLYHFAEDMGYDGKSWVTEFEKAFN